MVEPVELSDVVNADRPIRRNVSKEELEKMQEGSPVKIGGK